MDGLIKAAETLRAYDDFAIIAHISPDGDAIGSALGLRLGLKALGKTAKVVCEHRVPPVFEFLSGAEAVCGADAAAARCCVALDCADRRRLGLAAKLFDAAEITVCIDHHGTNGGFADVNYVDESAAATAETVYELLGALGVEIDGDMANCLYAAIVADTGRFSHSSTTAKTMRIAADLIEAGADASEISNRLFSDEPLSKARLRALAINRMELLVGGKVALTTITQADISALHASAEDTEGIVEALRDINAVEIAVFIRETRDGSYKVSMRSKREADVAAIATKFGGGGHVRAAGYTLCKSYAFVVNTLMDELLGAFS